MVSDLKESENMLEVINEKLLSILKQEQNLKKNKKDEKYKPGTVRNFTIIMLKSLKNFNDIVCNEMYFNLSNCKLFF